MESFPNKENNKTRNICQTSADRSPSPLKTYDNFCFPKLYFDMFVTIHTCSMPNSFNAEMQHLPELCDVIDYALV